MGCKYSKFILIHKILFTISYSKSYFCLRVAEWSHIPPQNRHTCGQHSQGKQSRIASHYSTVCVKCNPLSINPLRKLRAPRWRHALYISRYHSMNYIPRQMSRPEKSSPPDNKHKCPKIKSRPEGRLLLDIDFRLGSISTEEQPCKLSTFCYSHLCHPNSSYHRSRYLC